MTFEEFFKKKKINLQTFERGEAALFSEFQAHFEQMGEKSFDHTKKYWFNKLRLRFPAPAEIRVEKEIIENRIAEQTITESLIESSTPPPTIGFKPKFRAGVTKPSESATEATKPETTSENIAEKESPPTQLGFKPKFRMGITKPAESTAEQKEEPQIDEAPASKPDENKEAKPVYKPRFNMNKTNPKPPEE